MVGWTSVAGSLRLERSLSQSHKAGNRSWKNPAKSWYLQTSDHLDKAQATFQSISNSSTHSIESEKAAQSDPEILRKDCRLSTTYANRKISVVIFHQVAVYSIDFLANKKAGGILRHYILGCPKRDIAWRHNSWKFKQLSNRDMIWNVMGNHATNLWAINPWINPGISTGVLFSTPAATSQLNSLKKMLWPQVFRGCKTNNSCQQALANVENSLIIMQNLKN